MAEEVTSEQLLQPYDKTVVDGFKARFNFTDQDLAADRRFAFIVKAVLDKEEYISQLKTGVVRLTNDVTTLNDDNKRLRARVNALLDRVGKVGKQ